MSTKNKNYYLYNKIEYYRNFKLVKERQNQELEKKEWDKKEEIRKLKEEIQIKEEEHKKVRQLLNVYIDDSNIFNNSDAIAEDPDREDDKEIYQKKLKEYPIKLANLDKKIEEVDKLISNYTPENGNSIDNIIEGLKDEKKKINQEKEKLKKVIEEIHLQIKEIKESIRILELKNVNQK